MYLCWLLGEERGGGAILAKSAAQLSESEQGRSSSISRALACLCCNESLVIAKCTLLALVCWILCELPLVQGCSATARAADCDGSTTWSRGSSTACSPGRKRRPSWTSTPSWATSKHRAHFLSLFSPHLLSCSTLVLLEDDYSSVPFLPGCF